MDKPNNQEATGEEKVKQDKIYWHDAFYAALQLELHDYADALIFEDEHQLSKEALKMDVLIIKKTSDIRIKKNIGRIFKNHNIFEYKSEKDNLSIWDYNKVTGYAMIYSAFEEIPIEDITISFVVTPKPVKLFDHLANDRRFEVEEVEHGIYYIKGDAFKVQIIESKKLDTEENIFLKNLRNSLTGQDMTEVFDAFRKYGSLERVNIYLNRILDANLPVLKEVLSMSSPAVRDVIYKHLEENLEEILATDSSDVVKGLVYRHFERDGTVDSILERGEEKAKRNTALEMLRDGFDPDKVAHYVKMPLEWVESLISAKGSDS